MMRPVSPAAMPASMACCESMPWPLWPSPTKMLPSGAVMTAFGWLKCISSFPAWPATPSDISSSPEGLNLCTCWPLVFASLLLKSVTQTLPSLSTWMPCGVTMTPAPMLARTAPVLRSNLKIGATELVSQLMPGPPAEPDPHRS